MSTGYFRGFFYPDILNGQSHLFDKSKNVCSYFDIDNSLSLIAYTDERMNIADEGVVLSFERPPWMEEEDARALQALACGVPAVRVAQELGISVGKVNYLKGAHRQLYDVYRQRVDIVYKMMLQSMAWLTMAKIQEGLLSLPANDVRTAGYLLTVIMGAINQLETTGSRSLAPANVPTANRAEILAALRSARKDSPPPSGDLSQGAGSKADTAQPSQPAPNDTKANNS